MMSMRNQSGKITKKGTKTKLAVIGVVMAVVLAVAIPIGAFAASSNNTQYIGEESAKNIALTHASVTAESATFTKVKLERDDGAYEYDVSFISGNLRYEYDVNAITGDVQGFEKNVRRYPGSGGQGTTAVDPANYIGEDRAKTVALEYVSVSAESATFTKIKIDREDGTYVYDVEFRTASTKYDFEINAVNGDIQSFDKKPLRNANSSAAAGSGAGAGSTQNTARGGNSGTGGISTSATNTGNYIGIDKAKSIALSAAGLTESETRKIKVDLDREHGRTVYEVDFRSGYMEYEYDIDATTGDILKSDIDYDD